MVSGQANTQADITKLIFNATGPLRGNARISRISTSLSRKLIYENETAKMS
jgi:hypothetical protein